MIFLCPFSSVDLRRCVNQHCIVVSLTRPSKVLPAMGGGCSRDMSSPPLLFQKHLYRGWGEEGGDYRLIRSRHCPDSSRHTPDTLLYKNVQTTKAPPPIFFSKNTCASICWHAEFVTRRFSWLVCNSQPLITGQRVILTRPLTRESGSFIVLWYCKS